MRERECADTHINTDIDTDIHTHHHRHTLTLSGNSLAKSEN